MLKTGIQLKQKNNSTERIRISTKTKHDFNWS